MKEANDPERFAANPMFYEPEHFNLDDMKIECEQAGNLEIMEPPTNTYIAFHDINKEGEPEIGRLSWEDGIFKFEGNAKESAKVFFDFFIQHANINKCKCKDKEDVGNNCSGGCCSHDS